MATTKEQARERDVLTPREQEIARLLGEGSTVLEIADLLAVSAKTVDTHKTNLMKKLDIHRRAHLTLWAVAVGLVDEYQGRSLGALPRRRAPDPPELRRPSEAACES